MKKLYLIIMLVLVSEFGFSQVGINTTSPDAQLDIKSSNQSTPANNDGILIPKIDAFPVINPTAAQNSMMVYLTITSAGKSPGFYYWDNATTSWKGFGGDLGWSLIGNAGTNPATNFIGTTDDVDLVFRRNYTKAGFIGDDNVAFGTTAMVNNTFAKKNIAIGKNALFTQSFANGNSAYDTNNIAIGIEAMFNNNPNSLFTGKENTVVGNFALRSNSTGNQNIAIGNASLNSNSIGFNNVSVGNASSSLNQDGNNNTAIGTESLISNRSGSSATAIGYQAMRFANNTATSFDNKNVAIGYRSLFGSNNPVNNTGNNNTAIGYQSILSITSGNNNTAVGNTALLNNNTGSSNIAIGNNTLSGNTSGSSNIAIGDGANVPVANNSNQLSIANVIYGTNMSSMGTAKIGIGVFLPSEKLEVGGKTKTTTFQMTTGASAGRVLVSDAVGNGVWTVPGSATGGWLTGGNVGTNPAINFVGTTDNQPIIFKANNNLVGRLDTTNSVFFGYNAGLNSTGAWNVGIGSSTFITNSSGQFNTAVGAGSMYSNINGHYNAAYGFQALRLNDNGYFNTAIGDRAMSSNTMGINNTTLGHQSLLNNDTGSGNVALGSDTLIGNTTGSNNIAIGTNANVSVVNNNDQLSIANVVYGITMSSIANGKIGIGLTVPTEKLQVSDNIKIGNNAWASAINNRFLKFGDGNYVTIGEEIADDNLSFKARNFLFNPSIGNGNMGIGILTAPTEKLEVAGKTKTTDLQVTTGAGVGKILTSDAVGNGIWQTPTPTNAWNLTGNSGTNPATNFVGTIDNNDLILKRFNVQSGLLNSTNTSFGVAALNPASTGINNVALGRNVLILNTAGFQNTAVGALALPNNTLGSSNVGIGANTLNGNTTGSNNVAIGTNANVPVTNNSDQLSISNVLFGINMGTITTGKIGIGLTIPTEKLQVSDNIKIGNNAWATLADNRFLKFGDGNYVTIGEEIADDTMSLKAGNFLFNPSIGSGNVGIGILTAPTEKLEVAGKTKTTNFQMTTGAANGRILTSDATGNATWQIPASSGWLTTGNAGTNPATNFIGTTDNNDVIFKRFNVRSGLLNATNGNTSFGVSALNAASTGTNNTAFGKDAMVLNASGSENTAIGNLALSNNTDEQSSVAIGYQALMSLTSGNGGTAIGTRAMQNLYYASDDPGFNHNVALGYEALRSSTTISNNLGNFNTALGFQAMLNNSSGRYNTSVGDSALYNNDSGNFNIAIGSSAGYSNTNASSNVAIGNSALSNQSYSNGGIDWDTNNIAIGNSALSNNNPTTNTNGLNNTAIGNSALSSNKVGSNNIAIGYESLTKNGYGFNSDGDNNVALGNLSLSSNTTGNNNTAVGNGAMSIITAGYNNTALGYNVNPTTTNISNYMGLGYNVGGATSTNNMVEVGNTSVTSIRGQVNFTTYSDKRIKNNIQENVPGLSFITQLRPVTYNLDIHKQNEIIYKDKKEANDDWEGKYDIENIKQTGFIAQEVDQTAKSLNYDFSGVDAPKDNNGLFGLRYAEFVVPLVKAVQEQQEIINAQNEKIQSLENRLKAIEEKLSK